MYCSIHNAHISDCLLDFAPPPRYHTTGFIFAPFYPNLAKFIMAGEFELVPMAATTGVEALYGGLTASEIVIKLAARGSAAFIRTFFHS
jgi:hypothetical protein